MVRKKRGSKVKTKSGIKKSLLSFEDRVNLAWRNLTLFILLFLLSFVFYWLATSPSLTLFFGILSIILGFLAFAFLIAYVVLLMVKKGKKRK